MVNGATLPVNVANTARELRLCGDGIDIAQQYSYYQWSSCGFFDKRFAMDPWSLDSIMYVSFIE